MRAMLITHMGPTGQHDQNCSHRLAFIRLAVSAGCLASGIVTSSVELFAQSACRAEMDISALVPALAVLVVTCPRSGNDLLIVWRSA